MLVEFGAVEVARGINANKNADKSALAHKYKQKDCSSSCFYLFLCQGFQGIVNESRLVPGASSGIFGDLLEAGVRLLGVRWRTGAVFRLPPGWALDRVFEVAA